MPTRIEYEKGQILGPNGVMFLKELPPAIRKDRSRVRQAWFRCGECGKEFSARINNVKNGHTSSCGCVSIKRSIKTIQEYNALQKPPHNKIRYKEGDYIGDYGIQYVKETRPYYSPSNPARKKGRYILALCPSCHCEFEVLLENVVLGRTRSCGCIVSYGEQKIQDALAVLGIKFESQKKFNSLYGMPTQQNNTTINGHNALRFDFFLSDKRLCIEYDGIQHWPERLSSGSRFNTPELNQRRAMHDKIKNQWCVDNGLSLIRVSYEAFELIDTSFVKEMLDTPIEKNDYNLTHTHYIGPQ